MPAGTAFAPRRIPRRLAWLSSLPQGKIEGITLAIFQALAVCAQLTMARLHFVDIAARKLTVALIRTNRKVYVAFNLVGMTAFDEFFDQRDHLVDFLSGTRANIRVHYAGSTHIIDKGLGVFRSNLRSATALFVCLFDDLVVHVGDVLHELHLVATPNQIAANGVKRNKRASISDMNVVVHSWAAYIHIHLAVGNGNKGTLFTRLGIINLDHAISSKQHMRQLPHANSTSRKGPALRATYSGIPTPQPEQKCPLLGPQSQGAR